MYTQCPECGTAFRVTADVLKKAAGKVRCGGCGVAFNALLYLSETRPAPRPQPVTEDAIPELAPESFPRPGDITDSHPRPAMSAAQSAALLKTLDQLAGEDIRLEDTGVEWRLLGDDELANNDDGLETGGDFIDFSFGATATSIEAAAGDGDEVVFADTNVPIEVGLFRGATESRVDELLDDAPTPVDEFLMETPNDVDAQEVFATDGEAEIDASDVFASPATRMEDVLRFDDNTGLPDNFDFDSAIRSVPVPQPVFEPEEEPARTPPTLHADVAFGDPDEWVDLLDEFEPRTTGAGSEPSERYADTGANLALDKTLAANADDGADAAFGDDSDDIDEPPAESDAQPTLGGLTIEEELAALPDDYDEEAYDADAGDAKDPVAAMGIDLSGIYAAPAVSEVEDDDESADGRASDKAAGSTKSAEPELIELELDELPEAAAPAEAPDEPRPADPPAPRPAAVSAKSSSTEKSSRPAVKPPDKPAASTTAQSVPKTAAKPAARQAFPDSTGELEFELEQAQRRSSGDDREFDPTRTIVPPPTEEEHTINMMIDADLMRLAITDDEGMASTIVLESHSAKRKPRNKDHDDEVPTDESPDDSLFETIIMEGAFARTAQEQERLAAEAKARSRDDAAGAAQIAGQHQAGRNRSRRMQYGLIAGVVALVLLLAGQFVHQSRAALATIPAVGDAIAPIYQAAGAPISPEWDVTGWRFEVTRGSTRPAAEHAAGTTPVLAPDEEVLTIYSRLGNKSGEALPYPLLSVALTDRFEEVIGSKVFEPAEYLAAGANTGDMVAAGNTFEAVIAVAAPADSAAGFKLNVCYRHGGSELRCAIEDFR